MSGAEKSYTYKVFSRLIFVLNRYPFIREIQACLLGPNPVGTAYYYVLDNIAQHSVNSRRSGTMAEWLSRSPAKAVP